MTPNAARGQLLGALAGDLLVHLTAEYTYYRVFTHGDSLPALLALPPPGPGWCSAPPLAALADLPEEALNVTYLLRPSPEPSPEPRPWHQT